MQDIRSILDPIKAPQLAKADAWDAFHQSKTPDEFKAQLDKLPFDQKIKADLWDAKFASGSRQPQPDVSVNLDFGAGDGGTFLDSAMDFAKGFIGGVNPLPAVKGLFDLYEQNIQKNAEGGLGPASGAVATLQTGGQFLAGLGKAQLDQFHKGYEAYKAGNLSEAVGHTLAGTLPLMGPAAAHAGETIGSGRVAEGAGESAALLAPFALSAAKSVRVPPLVKTRLNPVEASRVAYMQDAGVPVDLATATGNEAARGAQEIAGKSLLGAPVVKAGQMAQDQALIAEANNLSDRAFKEPVTPEQAGFAVVNRLKKNIGRAKKIEDENYAAFREIEADPRNLQEVPVGSQSAAYRTAFDTWVGQSIDARLEGVKDVAQSGATEMTGKLKREYINPDNPHDVGAIGGRFGGGFKEAFPELRNFKESPSEIAAAIQKGGTNPLYQKLRRALRDSVIEEEGPEIRSRLREQGLDEVAQDARTAIPTMEQMAMPVDMRSIKVALKPMYDRMKRVIPKGVQNNSVGLTVLHSLTEGPDFLPASVAEEGLSGLKTLSREAAMPELRNVNEAVGARATELMQDAIDKAVANAPHAGEDAIRALRKGRVTHAAKMNIAEIYQDFPGVKQGRVEPVQAFDTTIWSNDKHIEFLRDLQRKTPREMAQLGRAVLDKLFDKSTRNGAFDRTQGVWADWERIGPETKRILFKDPMLVRDLNRFFGGAKDIARRTNPSQTGALMKGVGYVWTNPVTGIITSIPAPFLAEMFYNPKAVRILTRGMQVPLRSKGAKLLAADIARLAGDNAAPLKSAPAQPETNR